MKPGLNDWRRIGASKSWAALLLVGLALGAVWLTRAGNDVLKPGAIVSAMTSPAAPSASAAQASTAPATAAVSALGPPTETPPVALSMAKTPATGDQCTANVAGEALLRLGDQLKLSVFERTDIEDDKLQLDRSRPRSAQRSYKQRAEVSGDFKVEEDGTLNLPLLGLLPAAGHTVKDLQSDIGKLFEARIGHVGFVSVSIAERQPIYIIGPVKTPGAYKFTPGMTVLHSVALAGGFDRAAGLGIQAMDAIRESERHLRTAEVLKRLMAQEAVLKAERDGSTLFVPRRLVEISDVTEARALVDNEKQLRSLLLAARHNQQAALATTIKNLKLAVQSVQSRLQFLSAFVVTRSSREKAVTDLKKKGLSSNIVLSQVQGELSDSQQREQEAHAELAQVQVRLSDAMQEQSRVANTAQMELQRDLATIANQLAQEQLSFKATRTAAAVGADTLDSDSASGSGGASFEILRRTIAGSTTFAAKDICDLQPGDLIRVHASNKSNMVR